MNCKNFVLSNSAPELQIQLYGFNKELYQNMSEAQHKSQGIVGISLMVQIGDTPNPELRIITSTFNKVQYRGSSTPIRHISLRSLLPNTDAYLTYEGSTTHPGCWESTVWIILNKPIYITKQEVSSPFAYEYLPFIVVLVLLYFVLLRLGEFLLSSPNYLKSRWTLIGIANEFPFAVVRTPETNAGLNTNPKGAAGE